MTERSSGGGILARRLLFAAAVAAVLGSMAWAGLSRCPYTAYGDSSVALHNAQRIREGYLRHNVSALLQRLRGQPATPRQLSIEGGLPVVLAAVGFFGRRLPFLVNGLVVPLMLAAVMVLVWALDGDRRRGRLAALFALLFIALSPSLMDSVGQLCKPLRDAPAHALGFAGLAAAALAHQTGRSIGLFLGGALIGLSAWFRLPNGAFIVPAALFAISRPGLVLKERGRVSLVLAAGFGIGLLPLLAQAALEGQSLPNVGQTEILLLRTDKANLALKASIRRGLHPLNFRHLFLPVTRAALWQLPLWLRALLPVALAVGLMRWRRCALLLAGISLTFLGLYGCYDKVVIRYLVVAVLPLAALSGVFVARVFHSLLGLAHDNKRARVVHAAMLTALVASLTGLFFRQAGRQWAENDRTWQDALRFGRWCAGQPDGTRILSNDLTLATWMEAVSDGRVKRARWAWRHGGRLRHMPKAFKPESPPHLFALLSAPDGAERASWWLEDLQNQFDLTPPVRVMNLPSLGADLFIRRILPRARDKELLLPPEADRLFLLARELSVTGRWQRVVATHPDWSVPAVFDLQAGPHVLELPATQASQAPIHLHSDAPLPSFLICRPLDGTAIVLDFHSYRHFPVLFHCVQDAALHWRGYSLWERDWGGDGNEGHRSTPLFFVRNGSRFRIPRSERSLVVRFTLESGDDQPADLEGLMRSVCCRIGETEIFPEKEFSPVRELQSSSQMEYRLRATYSIELPASSPAADIELVMQETNDNRVLLVEIAFVEPSKEDR